MSPACGEATSCLSFPIFATMWGGAAAPPQRDSLGQAGGHPRPGPVFCPAGCEAGRCGVQMSPLDAPQPPAAFKGRRGAPRGRRREGRGHRRAAGGGRGGAGPGAGVGPGRGWSRGLAGRGEGEPSPSLHQRAGAGEGASATPAGPPVPPAAW